MTTTLLALFLFIVIFILMYQERLERRVAMLTGAGLFVALGGVIGFYPFIKVVDAIYFETLALIFGMSMISATLSKAGVFALWAHRTASYTHGNGWLALVVLALVTYFFSLFLNNLATMVVILPITLVLCRTAKMNTIPVLVVEIIASNLGGASTIMGDFPNMIISSAANLYLLDFMGSMMPICLILLAVMLLYFQWRGGFFGDIPDQIENQTYNLDKFLGDEGHYVERYNPKLARTAAAVLFIMMCGFLSAEWLGIRPGTIALFAGILLMFLVQFPGKTLFEAANVGDILFFLGLFIMVGGLQAAGVLTGITRLIQFLGQDRATWELIALMWVAALVTPFLSAGPATAFFIPVALEMSKLIDGDAVWWALSLGILAGSSMALTGATAGSIAATYLERDWQLHPEESKRLGCGTGLDFRRYLHYGLPVSLIFLSLSTFYIAIIAPD